MDVELWQAVGEDFAAGDTRGAAERLERRLREAEGDRFKALLANQFTNPPATILATLNAFVAACTEDFELRAVYCEMNGFDLNPDRWFFDLFGYDTCGDDDPEDLEWLCEWTSDEWPSFTLTGLEQVQADFAWYHREAIHKKQPELKPVYDTAVLLVMVRFVQLIERAVASGALTKPVPLLATAHDFDIVGRFLPRA